jgi:hypothetical protein
MPEPNLPEFAPAPKVVAETEPAIAADAPVIAPTGEPSLIADFPPDAAITELPAETSAEVEVVDPALFAAPEVEVEVAAAAPEVIAPPTTTDVASEESEQVWRLPPFDLPIMSAALARDDAASIQKEPVSLQFEVPPTAVQEPAALDAVEPSTQKIAAAPDNVDSTETPRFEASSAGPEVALTESSPTARSDSGPMLIAAAEEPAFDAPDSEVSEDAEPDRKPTIKVRRVGPRSKSRDLYTTRR